LPFLRNAQYLGKEKGLDTFISILFSHADFTPAPEKQAEKEGVKLVSVEQMAKETPD